MWSTISKNYGYGYSYNLILLTLIENLFFMLNAILLNEEIRIENDKFTY